MCPSTEHHPPHHRRLLRGPCRLHTQLRPARGRAVYTWFRVCTLGPSGHPASLLAGNALPEFPGNSTQPARPNPNVPLDHSSRGHLRNKKEDGFRPREAQALVKGSGDLLLWSRCEPGPRPSPYIDRWGHQSPRRAPQIPDEVTPRPGVSLWGSLFRSR